MTLLRLIRKGETKQQQKKTKQKNGNVLLLALTS